MPTYTPTKPGSEPWNNLGLRVVLLMIVAAGIGFSFANNNFEPYDVLGAFFATSFVFNIVVCIQECTRAGRKNGDPMQSDVSGPSLPVILIDALGCVAFLTIYIILVCGLISWNGGWGWGYYPTVTGGHAVAGGLIAFLIHGRFAVVGGYHYFNLRHSFLGKKGQRCPHCHHCNSGIPVSRTPPTIHEYDENADADANDSPKTEVPQMSMRVAADKKGKGIAADNLTLVANETGSQEGDRLISADNAV